MPLLTDTSAPRTARDRARLELTRAILDSARRQLAEVGPAALSVRAVARDLDMASSATYRYFRSRDELLTALIIEAYDELGEAVEHADGSVPDRADLAGRWGARLPRGAGLGEGQPARLRTRLRQPGPRVRRAGDDRARRQPRPADSARARARRRGFGHVSLELFGHMHNGILDYDAHFSAVVGALAADLGLR